MTELAIQTHNAGVLLDAYTRYFTGSSQDMSVTLLNNAGEEVVNTFGNRAKIQDVVPNAVKATMDNKIYVDEENGEDTNDGLTSSTAVKKITSVFKRVSIGSSIEIVLLSNASWSEDVYVDNIVLTISLNGNILSLVPKVDTSENRNFVYAITGQKNLVYFNGNNNSDSTVVLPVDATEGDISGIGGNSCFIKNGGLAAAGNNAVHFAYGVNIEDNDCYGIIQASNTSVSFNGASIGFTSPNRTLGDLVIGKISNDNGGYNNVTTNLAL